MAMKELRIFLAAPRDKEIISNSVNDSQFTGDTLCHTETLIEQKQSVTL